MTDEPRTITERLDAAKDGREFATVIGSLFAALEQARHEDDDDD